MTLHYHYIENRHCIPSKHAAVKHVFTVYLSVVDGEWSSWSDWSLCGVTCGGSVQVRSKECNNPVPENGGRPCPGNNTQQQPCGR